MAVAQLVESRIVIPVVAGSSPVSHPKLHCFFPGYLLTPAFFFGDETVAIKVVIPRLAIYTAPAQMDLVTKRYRILL